MASRTAALSFLAIAVAAGAIGFADGYQLYILALVGLTTIVGVGLNILLGMSGQIGTVEKGAFADLVAMPGDPLASVSALQSIDFVMKGGEVVRAPSATP